MVKINPLFYTLTNLTLEGPWYHIADCSIRVTSISGAILSRIFIVRTQERVGRVGWGWCYIATKRKPRRAVHLSHRVGPSVYIAPSNAVLSSVTHNLLYINAIMLDFELCTRITPCLCHLKFAHRGHVDNGMGPTCFESKSKRSEKNFVIFFQ